MSGYELKSVARKLIRDNSPKVFFVGLLFIIITTVMTTLQQRLTGTMEIYEKYLEQMSTGAIQNLGSIFSYSKPGGIPFAIVLWFLTPVISTGYKSYCLNISRGKAGGYGDIFDGFLFFGKVILLQIVTSVLEILWSLLFIIPGIVASYRYRQAFYILIDDPGKGVFRCISESKQMMKGKKLELFLIDFSFLGWYILNIFIILIAPVPFLLPLVSIWLTPYFNLTCAAYYNRLINDLFV